MPASNTYYDQMIYAENALVKKRKELLKTSLWLAALGLLAALAVGLGVFEVTLTFTLMNEIYGPELPGEATPTNVIILSGATLVAVAGYEVLKNKQSSHPALNFLENSAYYMVPIFFIGMLITFGMSDIVSAPVNDEIVLDGDSLIDTPEDGSGGFSELIQSIIGTFSSLALGGLVILNLLTISTIIDTIRTKLPVLLERRLLAKDAIAKAQAFIASTGSLAAVKRETARLDRKSNDLDLEAAAEIEKTVAPTLRTLSKMKIRQKQSNPSQPDPLARRNANLPHPLPDQKLIDTFVSELETKLSKLSGLFSSIFK
ncbi:hypothetical protein A8B75_18685 [Sphingomonadales bacterium EhC05]|nr:hypothetical protein A8B75_18685 [Sphingomonadales bacterium EhC05]